MADIKSIPVFQSNVGGLSHIFFVGLSNIVRGLFITPAGVFDIYALDSNNPDLADNIFRIEFSEQGASFKQESERVDSGEIYKQQVECIVSKDYYERTLQFNTMAQERFLVFAFDSNYQARIIGEAYIDGTSNGAKFETSSDTGEQFDSRNYIKLSFYCEATAPAPSLGSEGNSYFNLTNQEPLE